MLKVRTPLESSRVIDEHRWNCWTSSTGRGAHAAVSMVLHVADYYLVAHALAHGHTVVTHEVAAASRKRIKIPTACIGVRIKCTTPFEMLRVERARFVLGQTA